MQTIRVDDIDVAVVDQGTGPPLLLVHGFPLDHSMWRHQLAALSDSHRVIAPDLRGFGKTPLAATADAAEALARQGVKMERYAEDLAGLLKKLDVAQPVVLAGFSMGGYINWQFLRKFPDQVRALILCDTRAAADDEQARQGRLNMADAVSAWEVGRVAETMEPKLFAAQTRTQKQSVVAEVRSVISATRPQTIAAAQRGMAARPDMTALLPTIGQPTLVIVGSEDEPFIAGSECMADRIPNAELCVIEGSGPRRQSRSPGDLQSGDPRCRFES